MSQDNKNPIGWPLDELQKGDFIYDAPAEQTTLTDFAKNLRDDMDKEIQQKNENNFGNTNFSNINKEW